MQSDENFKQQKKGKSDFGNNKTVREDRYTFFKELKVNNV